MAAPVARCATALSLVFWPRRPKFSASLQLGGVSRQW